MVHKILAHLNRCTIEIDALLTDNAIRDERTSSVVFVVRKNRLMLYTRLAMCLDKKRSGRRHTAGCACDD